MTGKDVLAAHAVKSKRGFVVIPNAAFNSDEPVMLDGFLLHDLQKQLGLPLHALDFSGFTALLQQA